MLHKTNQALFLDRDGVINIGAEVGEYIMKIEDFTFAPGALKIIKYITDALIPIFVITNQQCIGKGLVKEDHINQLHSYMKDEIQKYGGDIEKIMVCPHTISDQCVCRKPKPGMILTILQQYPQINAGQSLFIGDSESDVEAGKLAGVNTLHIQKDKIIDRYDQIISFFDKK